LRENIGVSKVISKMNSKNHKRMTKEFKSFLKYTLFILFERKISKTNQRFFLSFTTMHYLTHY